MKPLARESIGESCSRAGGVAAAGTLAGLGTLHAAWAAGASWPFADRASLAAAVDGVREEQFPSAPITFGVSALLCGAAVTVLAHEQRWAGEPLSGVVRLGVRVIGTGLAARGLLGLLRPSLLPAGELPPFRRLNMLIYSPLCLLLGTAIGRSSRRGHCARP